MDVVSEVIVATTVTFADKSDAQSAPVTLSLTEANLVLAGSEAAIQEAVMDKGYHDNQLLADLARRGVRTYIPERPCKPSACARLSFSRCGCPDRSGFPIVDWRLSCPCASGPTAADPAR